MSKLPLANVKVLLVNLPIREGAPPNCAPLGVALLAARLLQHGVDVSIVDLNAYRVHDGPASARGLGQAGRHIDEDEALGLLRRHMNRHGEPTLIGLSGKITTLKWQMRVAAGLRRLCRGATIVSGGGLATQFGQGLFGWIPELDAVCVGDGDDVITGMVADAVVRDCRPEQTWPHVYTGARPENLDALPLPAWRLLDRDVDGIPVLETYIRNPIWGADAGNSSATSEVMGRSLNTVGSRGCPYSCAFCYSSSHGRGYKARSARSIATEMAVMRDRYDLDFVGLLDDNCLVDAKRIAEMPAAMKTAVAGRQLRWGTHGRLDEAAEPGRVAGLAAAGCVYLGFGAESASPRILEAMGKGGKMLAGGTVKLGQNGGSDVPAAMVNGYLATVGAGIHGNCTWILSFPNSTVADEKASVAFMQWQKTVVKNPATINEKFFTAAAYPGTRMFTMPVVRERLARGFGLSFNGGGQPVADEALKEYVLQLGDASKVLTARSGRPVFYGDTTEDQFLRMRELVDGGKTAEILAL